MKKNVLPLPGSLVTPTSPPSIAANRLDTASPNPVPPYRRVVELSACVKARKIRLCCSSVSPIPVSATEKRTLRDSPSSRLTRTAISPRCGNFTAFDR